MAAGVPLRRQHKTAPDGRNGSSEEREKIEKIHRAGKHGAAASSSLDQPVPTGRNFATCP